MKRELSMVLGLTLAACGDEVAKGPGDGAAAKTSDALCDGSEGVRLSLVTAGGGEVPASYAFTNPFGRQFLYVDGHCNFVSSTHVTGQLLTGTFNAAQGEAIGDALGFEATSGLLYSFEGGCPDAPANVFTTKDAHIASGCGDDQPPAQVRAALNWEPAFALAKTVGQPLTGPVSVAAFLIDAPLNSASLWPFSFPIEQAAFTGDNGGYHQGQTRQAKALSGADATLARQLWSSGVSAPSWRGFLPVTSGSKSYELFFRDELEPSFAAKLATFEKASSFVASCDASRVLTSKPTKLELDGHFVSASIGEDAPCGVELCWDGSFDEKNPVGAFLALQTPSAPRRCLGAPSLAVSANLQPMLDAFRAGYPHSAVVIDLGFGTLMDSEGDDAICRTLSAESCAADARCLPISAGLNDAARQCRGPNVALGCGAKTRTCGDALTGGQAPDGRRAVFGDTCIPAEWSTFAGEAPDYAWPVCTP